MTQQENERDCFCDGAAQTDSDNEPVVNGRHELSGAAVVLAHRNSRNMTKQGYCFEYWDGYEGEAGDVLTKDGGKYALWLPGVLTNYPEGKCACPYFEQEQVCKHLFFAVRQAHKTPSPATSWEASAAWDGLESDFAESMQEERAAIRAVIEGAVAAPLPPTRPLPKPMY